MLLAALLAVWLYPGWFGLRSSLIIRSTDGATIYVRDGDTLTIGKQDYRLFGIDAPELHQLCKTATGTEWACGVQARTELQSLVMSHTIKCQERAHDKYGRVVATCIDEHQTDVAQRMVERGLAVSFGGFAEGPYAVDETQAQVDKRGIWQGSFDPPKSWRASHPRTPIANR